MSLEKRLRDLHLLYGKRNALFLRGQALILWVNEGVRRFSKLIRKGETDKQLLGITLAGVFDRIAAYADSFIHLPIAQSLSEKYPLTCCAYCRKLPCICDLNRKTEITEYTASAEQLDWDIQRWCEHMSLLYGEVNEKNGLRIAVSRLIEEIQEVGSEQFFASQNSEISSVELENLRKRIALEFADTFAWIFSIAAMLEIDLQLLLDQTYGPGSKQWLKHFS